MTRTRWLRAALVGVVAAELAVLVGGGPRWRAAFPAVGTLVGFAADGATRFGLHAPRDGPPTLFAWDTATGRGHAVPLAVPACQPGQYVACRPSPDGRRVLAWTRDRLTFGLLASREPACHLCDTATGPGPAVPLVDPTVAALDWSPGGRWVVSRPTGHDRGRPDELSHPVVREPTGRVVCHVSTRSTEGPRDFRFLPDRSAVTLWTRTGRAAAPGFAVEWWSIPDGRVLRRFDLPAGTEWDLVAATADAVARARITWPANPADGVLTRTVAEHVVLDAAADPPRLAPLPAGPPAEPGDLQARREFGPGWVATAWRPATDPLPVRVRRAAAKRGWVAPPVHRCLLMFADFAGRPLPSPAGWVPLEHVVSPDRRRAADAPRPWPTVVAAGAVVAGGWAWFERRRVQR